MLGKRGADRSAQAEDVDQLARIANLLALLLVKGENQTDKILTLSGAGYAAGEIAKILGMTPNAVSVAVYQAKKKTKKAKSKSK